MSVVNETVEDGVCQGWVADGFMPVIDGQLAGDDGGTAPVTILEDFQQIPTL